ncbi:MAG TPA: hypothetical protein VNG90_03625 [Candidatus Acidoferrum sp.]|nr:hypothetical protein [Candidatus Acidoferrum sp.]
MRFKIGASIGCYLPWAAVLPGLAMRAAIQARFDFSQLLPLRGLWTPWGINRRALRGLPIRYMERAWGCPESLAKVAIDRIRHQPDCPTPVDYAFFGVHADEIFYSLRSIYPKAWVIEHYFTPGVQLVEIHPGLWMSVEQIKATVAEYRWLNKPVSLVADLCHMREEPSARQLARRPPQVTTNKSLLGRWGNSLPELLPDCHAIQIQPLRDGGKELAGCLKHQPTELGDMLICIKEQGGPVEDLIVEATLGLRGIDFYSLCAMLRDFRCWIAEQVS